LALASLSRDYGLNSGFDRWPRHLPRGGRDWLPEMMRPTKLGGRFCVASMAAMLSFGIVSQVRAENENFSNKPAPALFNADCTGTGCHKGPQGLGKGQT